MIARSDRGALVLDGRSLSARELACVARDPEAPVEIEAEALARVARGREQIDAIVETYRRDYEAYRTGASDRAPMQEYGVTTGFGEFKDIPVPPERLEEMQANLLRSHAIGIGDSSREDDPSDHYPAEVVRATIVVRLNAFLRGHSGVRTELVDTLLQMLHGGIVPLVPTRGSLGSSGDLCPLSHLFGVLVGDGRFWVVRTPEDVGRPFRPEQLRPASELADALSAPPATPAAKEGLALSNGATLSTAVLALAVHDAGELADVADVAAALSLEAACGSARAFDARVHDARGHVGQIESAAGIRALVEGSRLVDAANAVQDCYSLRCAPVVHGAGRDALRWVREMVEREMNAATDNPLFFPEDAAEPWDRRFEGNWPPEYPGRDRQSFSAGNFHGQPVALAADVLTLAVAEWANVSERRTQMLLDQNHSRNLPANLIPARGVNSGYMLAQYSAASLVVENRVLAHPASVDSVPTSANIEDHVACATTAARKLRTVLSNVQAGLAIELMVAAQAVDWRAGLGIRSQRGMGRSPARGVDGWEASDAEAAAFEEATRPENRPEIAAHLGRGTAAAYLQIREDVEPMVRDRTLDGDLRRVRRSIEGGRLLARVRAALEG